MKNKQIAQDIKDAKDTLEIQGAINQLSDETQLRIIELTIRVAEMIQRERLENR